MIEYYQIKARLLSQANSSILSLAASFKSKLFRAYPSLLPKGISASLYFWPLPHCFLKVYTGNYLNLCRLQSSDTFEYVYYCRYRPPGGWPEQHYLRRETLRVRVYSCCQKYRQVEWYFYGKP